jgi:hypothetical protein
LIDNDTLHIPILRQIHTPQFPFQYILSQITVLQNPNFPPKYGNCGTIEISSYS